ncbi:MAG: hypothetical protein ACFB2W_00455 [Leptolyngbyaceae cyanobacterium]
MAVASRLPKWEYAATASQYVSPHGDDTNDGRTSISPKRTISAAIAAIPTNGSIELASGLYREEADLRGKRINLKGPGTKVELPKLTTLNIIVNSSFSLVDGQANTYEVNHSHSLTDSNTLPFVFENGVALQYVADLANCESTPGSYTYSNFVRGNGSVLLRVHPVGSTDPQIDGKIYEASARNFAVIANQSNTVIEGIHCECATSLSGSLWIQADNAVVRDCLFTWGTRHHNQIQSGTFDRCIAYKEVPQDSRISERTSFVIFKAGARAADTVLYKDCVIHTALDVGFYNHTDGSSTFNKSTIEGCYAFNCIQPFASGNTLNLSISQCYAEDYRDFLLTGIGNISLKESTAISAMPNSFVVRSLVDGQLVSVEDFSTDVMTSTNAGGFWGAGQFNIRNCTLNQTGNIGDSIFYRSGAAASNAVFDIENCVLSGTYIYLTYSNGDFFAADNNLVWDVDGNPSVRIDGAARTGLTNWNTLGKTKLDQNSIQADPLYDGDISAGDFSLQPSSPAIANDRDWGARKWITQPDWSALTARWDAGFLALPRTEGGSRLVKR